MPDHATPRGTSYIDVATLRALVRDFQATNDVSPALAKALLAIAGGVWDRYRFTADKEDFVQDVTVHLLQQPLKKADAQKHVFNYFTTCAIRFGMKLREKANGDKRRFETYAAELVEAGYVIPKRHE